MPLLGLINQATQLLISMVEPYNETCEDEKLNVIPAQDWVQTRACCLLFNYLFLNTSIFVIKILFMVVFCVLLLAISRQLFSALMFRSFNGLPGCAPLVCHSINVYN